jgi:hypothetical protein
LEGDDQIYRLRAGDYRILYQVKGRALLVLIVRILNKPRINKNGCMWPPVTISEQGLDQTVHHAKCKTPTSTENTASKAGETILDAQ